MCVENEMNDLGRTWSDDCIAFRLAVAERELTPYELYVRAHNLYCTRPAKVSMTAFITDNLDDWTRRWYNDWYECAVAFAVGKHPIFVMNEYQITSWRTEFQINP